METIKICLNAVLPIFLMIFAGFICRRTGLIKAQLVAPFNRVAFTLLLSSATFYNIYTSNLRAAFSPRLIVFATAGVLAEFLLAMLWAEKKLADRSTRGVFIQGVFRSNYTIIGLSFLSSLMGTGADMGIPSILLAFIVPVFNVLAVISLEKYNGERTSAGKVIINILKNPLIIGAVLGILCQLAQIKLPSFIEKTVKDFGNAASPVMLLLLGAFLTREGVAGNLRLAALTSAVRLLLCPAVFLAISVLLGFRGMELASLIVVFASSTAVSSFTMASQMGGDADLAGSVVIITSALCPFTMGLWSFVLMNMGLI